MVLHTAGPIPAVAVPFLPLKVTEMNIAQLVARTAEYYLTVADEHRDELARTTIQKLREEIDGDLDSLARRITTQDDQLKLIIMALEYVQETHRIRNPATFSRRRASMYTDELMGKISLQRDRAERTGTQDELVEASVLALTFVKRVQKSPHFEDSIIHNDI